MKEAGLSLKQSPPFKAIRRFFITTPIFIILAGFFLIFEDISFNEDSIRDSINIAFVHIFTLGIFTMTMFGALGQMLPVIGGVTIPRANIIFRLVHLFLVLGIIFFLYGFMIMLSPLVVILASTFLFLSFTIMLGTALFSLRNSRNLTPTIKAMIISILSGLITSFLGIWLLQDYITGYSQIHIKIASIHMVWGFFAFAGILVIGVSFKIVPMFYVASRFKQFCKKRVVYIIIFGIILWSFLSIFLPKYNWLGVIIIATFFLAFSTAVLLKFNKRKRPISDVTVWYWRSAMISLFITMIIWVTNRFISFNLDIYLAIFLAGGFILSLITGMLYKIVPFLVWFHLSSKGNFKIPTMREMINENIAKIQFLFHILSLLLLIFAYNFPYIIKFAGVAIIISGSLILFNLLRAVVIYEKFS